MFKSENNLKKSFDGLIVRLQHSQPTIQDFNIPWNSPDHIDTQSLAQMLNTFNLNQLMNFPTQKAGNTLDWIMHRAKQTTSKA